MDEDVFFAEGSDLYIGAGTDIETPGAWTSIGCAMTVRPPAINQSFRQVKPCLKKTTARVERSRPSTITYGSIGVTLRYDADQDAEIQTLLETQATKPIAIILGDTGKAKQATCWVESHQVQDLTDEGEVLLDVSFKVMSGVETVDATTITGGGA